MYFGQWTLFYIVMVLQINPCTNTSAVPIGALLLHSVPKKCTHILLSNTAISKVGSCGHIVLVCSKAIFGSFIVYFPCFENMKVGL
jgi:hypothetical protein